MAKRRGWKPECEALESVELLSGVTLPPAPPPSAQTAVQSLYATTRPALTGSVQGIYAAGALNPDAGTGVRLTAGGRLAGVGAVFVSGSLHPTGFIANGRATGTLTLRNLHGTVSLALTGPIQKGFSPLPDQFAYEVVAGTGRYAGTKGTGTVDVVLGSGATPSGRPGRVSASGTITLSFHPGAVLTS